MGSQSTKSKRGRATPNVTDPAVADRSGQPGESAPRTAALAEFETLRAELVPLAEARGIVTDEDVFAAVS